MWVCTKLPAGAPLPTFQVCSPRSSPPQPVSASSLRLPLLPLFLPYLVLTRNASSCPCSAWPYLPPEPEKWAQNGCPGWASEGPHFKGTGKRSVSCPLTGRLTSRQAEPLPGETALLATLGTWMFDLARQVAGLSRPSLV